MNKQRNLLIIWTLILTLLTGGWVNNISFLCFEEDGHINVEFALCHTSAEASTTSFNGSQKQDLKTSKSIFSLQKTSKYFTTKRNLTNKSKKYISYDKCGNCTDIPLFTNNLDNMNFLNEASISFDKKDTTIYFYYPVKIDILSKELHKFPLFEELSLNSPNFSFINTTTTVLLN